MTAHFGSRLLNCELPFNLDLQFVSLLTIIFSSLLRVSMSGILALNIAEKLPRVPIPLYSATTLFFRRIVQLKAFHQRISFLRRQILVKRGSIVRVQIVLHFNDDFCLWPVINNLLLKPTIIGFRSSWINFDQTLARQRLESDKDRCDTAAFIFVIKLFDRSRLHLDRRNFFAEHLKRQFVQANDRTFLIVWQSVKHQQIFHSRQIFARNLTDAPHLLQMRLERVFFSISPTVLCEILSTKPCSTDLSASSRRVQRACPAGASEQARAVIRAFSCPVRRGGLPDRGLSFKLACKPSAR